MRVAAVSDVEMSRAARRGGLEAGFPVSLHEAWRSGGVPASEGTRWAVALPGSGTR